MTNPTYPSMQAFIQGFPAHLAESFRMMVRSGRTAAEVCVILTDVLTNPDIETVPPLPDGWRLLPHLGELKIEAEDGTISDAREYFFQPRREVLRRFSQLGVEAKETPKATVDKPPLTARQVRKAQAAERKVQKAALESQAAGWLTGKPDLKAKPEHHMGKCRKEFPELTIRGFLRALKVAREKSGLLKRRKRSSKRQAGK